jgi:hypothetical protein
MSARLAEAYEEPSPRLVRPPFPFRLTRTRCTAEMRCVAATAVVEEWRERQLWGNQWQAFELPQVDAQHPCLGCPVLEVVQEGPR